MAQHPRGLTADDLVRLAELTGWDPDQLRTELRRRPWLLADLLTANTTADALMAELDSGFSTVSSRLFFAVMTHRAAAEVREATWVNDWVAPRSRVPVFDVEPLQEFSEESARLLFLAGILASYTGPNELPVPASELDLDELADWLQVARPDDQSTVLLRLGDLALFLAGVFPDRTGAQPVGPDAAQRLGVSAGMDADEIDALCDAAGSAPGLDALETLGAHWYDAAARHSADTPAVVRDVAARFRSARRFLNQIADRHLFPPNDAFGSVISLT